MAEEQEVKKKPKTALIKHRKSTSQEKSETIEKKKVVVVKKKVVKVKKRVPKVVVKSESKPEETEEKKKVEQRHSPEQTEKPKNSRPPSRGTEKGNNQTFKREPRKSPPERRPPYKPGGPPDKSRPPYRGGPGDRPRARTPLGRNAPFRDAKKNTGRTSAPSTGKPPAKTPPTDNNRKQAGRKFYKTKKKDSGYSKRRFHSNEDKMFQIKKKQSQKTNPVPKEISIMEVVTVSELARKMNLKAKQLIEKLMGMGMMVTINQQIDAETATILAGEFDCKVKTVSLYEETVIKEEAEVTEEEKKDRPPIVTVMGHVDHGKTKLLDAIRAANVVDSEFGGITQHIGAYSVDIDSHKIVFLDTPGHEAFTLMRARGAQITDIVILIVAANDGVMPQTIEAINHAKEANVPIIVAVNKIDLVDANVEKVKKQLSEYNLIPEEWGGGTIYCEVSALKKEGIKELLDSIILQTEMMELKANYDCRASGKVIESKIDFGRGIVATVLIEKGTLRIGDSFVAGIFPGKVRALFDDKGQKVDEVTPGLPVEVLGFTGIPDAGDPFQITENERLARNIGDKRQELKRLEDAKNIKKVTLDNLYDKIKEGEIQELKVIVKGDVHGSVEALKTALEKLSTAEIRLVVINALAGAINRKDIMLAAASNAIIVGFHVRPTPKAQILAEQEKVEIRKYNVIYDAIEDIRLAMEGLLSPLLQEQTLGTAEVRQVFKVPKIGLIAGCYVLKGKIRRNCEVHLIRDGIDIYQGKISSLKRFKDDAKEVETSYECGIGIEGYNDVREGDLIEAFEMKEVTQKLGKAIKDKEKDGKVKSKTS